MASTKRKLQKKKEREREVQVKVANRREALQKQRKLAYQAQLREAEIDKLVNGKKRPFVKSNQADPLFEEMEANKIKEQLQHNIEILQALEADYEAEQKGREEINNKLNEQGFENVQEKLKALYEQSMNQTDK